jgi:hypothetical protein
MGAKRYIEVDEETCFVNCPIESDGLEIQPRHVKGYFTRLEKFAKKAKSSQDRKEAESLLRWLKKEYKKQLT